MNDPKVMRDVLRGGWGCDAAWADDFHHALRVLLTGDREGYYAEFGAVADLAKAFHRPHVHDGTYSTLPPPPLRRAAPTTCRPSASSSSRPTTTRSATARFGERLPVEARPLAALCTLLSPFTPMLFQGEEYGEHAPFQFFSDHIDEDIATATREGRRREFAAFAEFRGREVPDPQDPATFEASKLTRDGRAGGPARALRRSSCACGASSRRATPTRSTTTSTPAGCACGAALRAGRQLLPPPVARPARRDRRAVVAAGHVTLEPGYVRADRRCPAPCCG